MTVEKHPNYWAIWAWLLVMTVVEVWVATFAWSKQVLLIVLLALAIWKALLVALYFMHLRFEKTRLRIFAIAPLPLTVIIVLAGITEFIW